MQAFVHKSLKKAATCLYLAAREDFVRLPDALRARLALHGVPRQLPAGDARSVDG